uniref:Ras family protein n=1 Tax=Setaria digitata TaxID=48799 RepID=A0A915PQV1_9BILA
MIGCKSSRDSESKMSKSDKVTEEKRSCKFTAAEIRKALGPVHECVEDVGEIVVFIYAYQSDTLPVNFVGIQNVAALREVVRKLLIHCTMESDDSFDFLFKIVLIGDMGVGKTCVVQRKCEEGNFQKISRTLGTLQGSSYWASKFHYHSSLVRFKNGTFIERQGTTIGVDFSMKTLIIEGKRVKLQIWDTGGQERFRTITQSYYRSANGILLCYDLTCRQSFESLHRWLDDVSKFAAPNVCKVLVATKADLENERFVERDEGRQLANRHGMCMFIETSSKSNLNVDNAFLELAHQLKRQYEAGVHLDSQLDAFKISQGTTAISSKWACCHYL